MGEFFVFMAIVHYTKWIETKILRKKRPSSIVEAINDLKSLKNDNPGGFLTDCGKELIVRKISAFLISSKVKHVTVSPLHHQPPGVDKGFNSTFMSKLCKLASFKKGGWKEQIDKATLAVDLIYHRALITSLFIWGYKILYEQEIDKYLSMGSIFMNGCALNENRKERQIKYSEDILQGKKELMNQSSSRDTVWIHLPRKNKMFGPWHGSFQIKKEIETMHI